ncbi:hypothetical protein K3495_g17038 [Podosphaera aphanis]|nr:hypothetical protein K3495_g17038 [Podosphaera aphanis]
MALALATKQYIWIQRGLRRFLEKDIPAAVSTDNAAAIELAHNPKINDASKHIDIAYHFTREKIEDGLPRPRHCDLCTSIFGK